MNVVFHYDAGPGLIDSLQSLAADGLDVEVISVKDRHRFAAALKTCEVLWHVLQPITADDIASAPNLKLIHKFGVGVDTIDLDAARAHGVRVCNMPGTNSQAVAEMTLLLMLSTLRRLAFFDHEIRMGRGWAFADEVQDRLGEISGRAVGFVGYGEIPKRLTPVLKSLGARVVYTATSPKPEADAEWMNLDALLRTADIVSVHVPLTGDTRHLINADAIASMKPGSILINTARGGVIEPLALYEALSSGHLGAAGLDVFVAEPLPEDDPILALDNVVVSPHVAWLTRETLERNVAEAVEACRCLRNDEDLSNRVV